MRNTALKLCLSLLLLSFSIPHTWAQASIEVIVNDKAVTSYDIRQRAKLITLTQRSSGAAARRLAEQELIDDIIKLDEAERIGVSVSDQEISSAFANIAKNVKLSPSRLSQALRQNGVDPQTLKDRLEAQIAWQKIVRMRFQSQIEVSESDIAAGLKKLDKEETSRSVEYDLQRIVVVVPENASAGFKAKRKREAAAIRKAFNGCEDAGKVLGQYKEVVMRPVGRRLETELNPQLREVVKDTEVGRLAAPQKIQPGYEMVAVCGKREIESDIAARAGLENELRAKEGQQLARRYLRQLKTRATIVQK